MITDKNRETEGKKLTEIQGYRSGGTITGVRDLESSLGGGAIFTGRVLDWESVGQDTTKEE